MAFLNCRAAGGGGRLAACRLPAVGFLGARRGPASRLAVLQRFMLTTFRIDPYLMNPLKVGDVILCGPLKRSDVDEKVKASNARWPGVTVDVLSWAVVERMCQEAAGEPRRAG